MTDPAPAAPEAPQAPATPPAAPTPAVVPPTPPAAPQPAADGKQGIEAFPEAAQKMIKDLRQEAQRYRTGSEDAAKTAAEAAKKELVQALGKSLGLIEDDADPAKLADALKASQADAADRERELAVYKAAAAAGADPARLLDSRSFLAAIKDIDPAKTDELTAAIKTAVQTNPTLGAAPTAGASTVDHAGGSGEGAVTPEQFKAMGYKERVTLYETNRPLYDKLAAL